MFDSNTILLIEDNEDDAFFFQRALQDAGIRQTVHNAADGQKGVDYLSGHGAYSDRSKYPLPWIIFVDLKLPRKSGFDLLEWIKQRPELKDMIVIVLTSSDEQRDVTRVYEKGARSYLVKPPTREMLIDLWQYLSLVPRVRT